MVVIWMAKKFRIRSLGQIIDFVLQYFNEDFKSNVFCDIDKSIKD